MSSELATTMASRKILWSILGIYLLILANVAIVNGDAGETTTDALVSGDDTVTEGILENEPYTTTTNDCFCNCKNHDHVVECVTETQQQSQTENIKLGLNENYTTHSALEATSHLTAETDTVTIEAGTNDPNEGSGITTGAQSIPEGSTTTATPPPRCSTPGILPHETDCHAFYDCSSAESSDGSLRLLTKFCSSNQAFNSDFNSCSRDISTCANAVVCLSKGGIADPLSNSSYYLCEPRVIGGGFYVFHVECGDNEIFYPEVGKCFIDFRNFGQQPFPGFPPYNWNQIQDIDIVKAEMKVIKEHDKLKLKFENEKIKAERRLQKDAAKEAERIAKEKDKLTKDLIKQESANFVCLQEGNFASSISETVYYACVAKKTSLKKVLMKCSLGSKFNAASGACVTDGSPRTVIPTDDEGDDD